MYSDTVTLTMDNAFSVLEMAHYYQVTNLVQFCADYLGSIITSENVCEILTLAMHYEVTTLICASCNFIDKHAETILTKEGFFKLSEECLMWILKGDTFYANEDRIFIKAEEWAERKLKKANDMEKTGANIRKTLGTSFFYLRLPTMSFENLMKCTRKKGYFSFEEYENIVEFINKFPDSSVKSNSCVARLPTEETMTLNDQDGETNVVDNINTKFQISVSRDVKLTNFIVTEIHKYLKYKEQNYRNENCQTISISESYIDRVFSMYSNKALKLAYDHSFSRKSVQELKAVDVEDLSDKLDIVISGTFKVTHRRSTTFLRDKSEKFPTLNKEESTAGNGGRQEEVYEEGMEKNKNDLVQSKDNAVYDLIFKQDFQIQSSSCTSRTITLTEPLTLTKAASPYTVEMTMNYGCTSEVKMKTPSSKSKTVTSKFGQLQVQDIAGCINGTSGDYNNTWSRTKYGRRCQRWDSQTPHEHYMNTPAWFPGDNSVYDAHKYCRNPDGKSGGVWCYTEDPSVRWEYCDIPAC